MIKVQLLMLSASERNSTSFDTRVNIKIDTHSANITGQNFKRKEERNYLSSAVQRLISRR